MVFGMLIALQQNLGIWNFCVEVKQSDNSSIQIENVGEVSLLSKQSHTDRIAKFATDATAGTVQLH